MSLEFLLVSCGLGLLTIGVMRRWSWLVDPQLRWRYALYLPAILRTMMPPDGVRRVLVLILGTSWAVFLALLAIAR